MPIFDIKVVDLESLTKAFEPYNSWKDFKSADSDFVKFLQETCKKNNAATLNNFEKR